MLLFSGKKRGGCFSSTIVDFAGNDSSEPLIKEVIPERETMTNPFLSPSNIPAS